MKLCQKEKKFSIDQASRHFYIQKTQLFDHGRRKLETHTMISETLPTQNYANIGLTITKDSSSRLELQSTEHHCQDEGIPQGQGDHCQVCSRPQTWFIACGKFIISVPNSLEISPGSKLVVQFHLYQTAVSHRFACKAMDYDSSSRLAISIKGPNASGNIVDTWLHSSGESKLAMRMNTFIDLLEDVPFNETCLLRRRWIINRSETGIERQTKYTD
ncbi:hypothetical protein N7504_009651 [Penicillium tannophilum]|nr:hypothetical protein N7504_009651 [Penicillium tannophilum]